jgi:hypothetical protein
MLGQKGRCMALNHQERKIECFDWTVYFYEPDIELKSFDKKSVDF